MSRHYCFTSWEKPKTDHPGVRYMIIGEEKAPTTGKTHWQGYAELYKPQRITGFKKMCEQKDMHVEIRKGTREQARDYCKKEGRWEEYGKWIKGQGHRSDLEAVAKSLVNGEKTLENVMEEEPVLYCKYRNGLKDLSGLGLKKSTKNFREVEVIVMSGPTGCGKTRSAVAMSEDYYKIEGEALQWFDGYAGEECLVIDEYNNDVGITKMLNLLDGYQLRLATKGSFTYAKWTKVVITTNLKREELHLNAKPAHRDALFRRITEWVDLW